MLIITGITLFIGITLISPLSALTTYQQGDIFPVGYQEKYLGNSGAALAGEVGNAIYNPGAHCFSNKIGTSSAGGISLVSMNAPNLSQTDKISSTLAYMAIQKSSKKTSFIFYANSPFSMEGKWGNGWATKLDHFGIGASLARKFNGRWGIGLSTEIARERLMIDIRNSIITENEITDITMSMENTFLFIKTRAGLFVPINHRWNFGFRLTPPLISIKSEQQTSSQILSSHNGKTYSYSSSDQYSNPVTSPWDALVGVNFLATSYWKILIDVGHIFTYHSSYDLLGNNNNEELINAQWRISIGSTWQFSNNYSLLFGSAYKFRKEIDNFGNSPDEIYRLFTAGIAYKRPQHELIVGGFINNSEDTSKIIGINISTMYYF
ncbi:MAG: hypothetical protein A2504_11440 [Bdellovibrionales bacterium RIFOXYD12_FULL_39_22]|nr:MAG: hypothetical protein A2385_15955 [Bdellovibrionales bacterium RIFOXYB1_FULL_39_21]OFZ44548.1 MAG: hypothetical protein A2485_06940 [Bdellovibrionales bacterium RIFOXYC12_FULL_39_17]OFZ49810.1 MAG: hypothetical protein A2404_00525 [Bdellovibrionales bacterium RIFOXYC1_FULL_39_130]OFZ72084.1 MAG: hypothetical protein A2451_09190 [Bdellovibrionales bacterium RIFOXYC2_FULL_39_8]OFZ76815.1 MAG: hypothetical protein A2560_05325 [Bdellovibrionales bacterium RIFOXYD1_FULL_39_84]OFZ95742.1 MAG: